MICTMMTVLLSIILLHFIGVSIAQAAVFPDVPDAHIYREPVELLVGRAVINGNPDGNFYPEKSVNRAEMLKMLYIAAGKIPADVSERCFPDILPGSWYEKYVCDASFQGYVQGYSDGLFRPANTVNRVEAIKMIAEVFEISVPELTDQMREVVKFVDVSVSAWYTKYLYAAFVWKVLPIAGQGGPRLFPESPLLRGEAAAYIFNALKAVPPSDEEVNESTETEELSEEGFEEESQGASSSSASASKPEDSIENVLFPFDVQKTFTAKRPHTYRFTLSSAQRVAIDTKVSAGEVICRLYKIRSDGFSVEYYLGFQEGGHCFFGVSLVPGDYQLQVQPTVGDSGYTLSAQPDPGGDGNDGFSQAKLLSSTPRTDTLGANDFADWFTFSLTAEKKLTVEAASQAGVTCLVYPMDDVDLYGFSGPQCNQSYLYPSGTYYVGISRRPPKAATQAYTVRLK